MSGLRHQVSYIDGTTGVKLFENEHHKRLKKKQASRPQLEKRIEVYVAVAGSI
jgi:hypothetical protein